MKKQNILLISLVVLGYVFPLQGMFKRGKDLSKLSERSEELAGASQDFLTSCRQLRERAEGKKHIDQPSEKRRKESKQQSVSSQSAGESLAEKPAEEEVQSRSMDDSVRNIMDATEEFKRANQARSDNRLTYLTIGAGATVVLTTAAIIAFRLLKR